MINKFCNIKNYKSNIPKNALLISLVVYGIFLITMSFMRFASHDEALYLTEAANIADALRHGNWFGDLPVGRHGFFIKTITAILFLIFGNSVFVATLVTGAISVLTFWLCFRFLKNMLKSEWWALAGTWLVFANPVVIFCSYKYLVDIPAMCAVLLIIEAVMKKKNTWIIGLLFLLAIDVREYLLFIIGPALVLWIILEQLKIVITKNKFCEIDCKQFFLLKQILRYARLIPRFTWKVFLKCTIVLFPIIVYLVLMFTTTLLPLNIHLTRIIGATNRGLAVHFKQISPKFSIGKGYNTNPYQLDLVKITENKTKKIKTKKKSVQVEKLIKPRSASSALPPEATTPKPLKRPEVRNRSTEVEVRRPKTASQNSQDVYEKPRTQKSETRNQLPTSSPSLPRRPRTKASSSMALCQNIDTVIMTTGQNANVRIQYVSFPKSKQKNLLVTSYSQRLIAFFMQFFPKGWLAMMAGIFTALFFKCFNLIIEFFNVVLIYCLKIAHPTTFNFNKLPHIIIFFAVPAAFIISWSWFKKRQFSYLFISLIFFIYIPIHIIRWSVIRYMIPFLPVVILFFLFFLKDLSKRFVFSLSILILTIIAVILSLSIDTINVPVKFVLSSISIIAVLLLILSQRKGSQYATRFGLLIPIIISFFTLSTSLYIIINKRDTQGAPIRSFVEYGYNRECKETMNYFSKDKIIWLNNTGVSSLPLFYRGDKAPYYEELDNKILRKRKQQKLTTKISYDLRENGEKTFFFDAYSVRFLEKQIKKRGILEVGLTVSDISGRTFKNQNLLPDLINADWLELREKVKLKNKTFYLFSVLSFNRPINISPQKESLSSSLTPELFFNIKNVIEPPVATHWQIREVGVFASVESDGVTNRTIYSPNTLNGSSWLSSETDNYHFNGKTDLIDCKILYKQYKTICAWIKPDSVAQKSIVVGNFGGTGNDYWNKYTKGLQYHNGIVYATGDNIENLKKISASVNDKEWYHVAATFSSNGTLYVNGVLQDTGNIEKGHNFDFAIGAARKHINVPKYKLNQLNFNGYIDDVMVYKDKLTTLEISNIWNSTKDFYTQDGLEKDNFTKIKSDFAKGYKSKNQNVVFSEKWNRNWNSCKINTIVSQTWDSGVISNSQKKIKVPDGMLKEGKTYYWQVKFMNKKGVWSRPSEPTRFQTKNEENQ